MKPIFVGQKTISTRVSLTAVWYFSLRRLHIQLQAVLHRDKDANNALSRQAFTRGSAPATGRTGEQCC
jgi:hypothetical protein